MNDSKKIKNFIRDRKIADGLLCEMTPCTEEENEKYKTLLLEEKALPENIFPYTNENGEPTGAFYIAYKEQYTHEQIMEYLALKTCRKISNIQKLIVAALAGLATLYIFVNL